MYWFGIAFERNWTGPLLLLLLLLLLARSAAAAADGVERHESSSGSRSSTPAAFVRKAGIMLTTRMNAGWRLAFGVVEYRERKMWEREGVDG